MPPSTPEVEVLAGFLDLSGARAWYLRGRAAELRGDLEEAERSFKWVARLDRSTPGAMARVGGFYERSGRPDDALEAYERALERAGPAPAPEIQLALGRLLRARADPMARSHLDSACPGPGCEEAFEAAHADGDHDAAVAVLHRWRLADQAPAAATKRAECAERLQEWGLAVEDWLTVLATGYRLEVARRALVAAAHAGDPRVVHWLEARGLPVERP